MIPTQAQFDLLYSDYQQLDTPERFGQFIFNRTGFEIKGSYNETDTQAAWYMLRRAVMINQLTPATDWVKCADKSPPFNKYVLIWDGEDQDVDWLSDTAPNEFKESHITHWMPLPAPPVEVE